MLSHAKYGADVKQITHLQSDFQIVHIFMTDNLINSLHIQVIITRIFTLFNGVMTTMCNNEKKSSEFSREL